MFELNSLPAWLITAVSIVAAVFSVLKAIKSGKGDVLAKALTNMMSVIGTKEVKRVYVPQDELDVVYEELATRRITDNGLPIIQSVLNRIVAAFDHDPKVQSVVAALFSTILDITPNTTLKRAYTAHAEQVLSIVDAFTTSEKPGKDGESE